MDDHRGPAGKHERRRTASSGPAVRAATRTVTRARSNADGRQHGGASRASGWLAARGHTAFTGYRAIAARTHATARSTGAGDHGPGGESFHPARARLDQDAFGPHAGGRDLSAEPDV